MELGIRRCHVFSEELARTLITSSPAAGVTAQLLYSCNEPLHTILLQVSSQLAQDAMTNTGFQVQRVFNS